MLVTAVVTLLAILAFAIPVAAGLGWLGLILDEIYSPFSMQVTMGQIAWSSSSSFIMVAIPFYIMLGEILLRTGIAERMYGAVAQWVSWLPGGLMHSNIAASSMFAAVSGSSVATAVTIGTVAVDQIAGHRYNERLFLGSIAAGGTLGILIPPSINLVVYGVMTDTSIPKLYLAGIVPGLLLTALFMLTILIACMVRPSFGGTPMRPSWGDRLRSLPGLVPPLILFGLIIGSIYMGLATATEAAALGIVGALVLAAFQRRLSVRMLVETLEGTVRTTGLIMAIVVAAYFLNVIITTVGIPRTIGQYISARDLSPTEILVIVVGIYLVMGMFMETLSMMVATIPITAPIMIQAGYDPVWFGILIVLLMETALLTPPVGMNLFVVQGIRRGGALKDVMIGTAPFVVALLFMILILCLFPRLTSLL